MSHLALKPTVPSYLVELAGVDTHIKRVFRAPDSVFSCSGKTQLLLNHAYAVAEAGGSVLVIRSHAASPTDAMLFKGGDIGVLERISFKYVDDDANFNRLFANFHLLPHMPHLLAIDDLDLCLKTRKPLLIAHALALVIDASAFASAQLAATAGTAARRCRVLATDTLHSSSSLAAARPLFVIERFLPTVLTIDAQGELQPLNSDAGIGDF
jgi:hypothetical protein